MHQGALHLPDQMITGLCLLAPQQLVCITPQETILLDIKSVIGQAYSSKKWDIDVTLRKCLAYQNEQGFFIGDQGEVFHLKDQHITPLAHQFHAKAQPIPNELTLDGIWSLSSLIISYYLELLFFWFPMKMLPSKFLMNKLLQSEISFTRLS